MGFLSDQSEAARRAQDSGRVNRAWRWFSTKTIKAAQSYRDISWVIITAHMAAGVVISLVSRIDPTQAYSPWMLLGGVIWLGYGLRMGALKAIGQAASPPEPPTES